VTFLGSSFGFPDASLLLFWTLGLAFVVQAFQSGKGAWWLAAGAALGAGMLSKYTAVFLGASLTLYLLVTPKDRHWLKTPWPYLGAVVALIVFFARRGRGMRRTTGLPFASRASAVWKRGVPPV